MFSGIVIFEVVRVEQEMKDHLGVENIVPNTSQHKYRQKTLAQCYYKDTRHVKYFGKIGKGRINLLESPIGRFQTIPRVTWRRMRFTW